MVRPGELAGGALVRAGSPLVKAGQRLIVWGLILNGRAALSRRELAKARGWAGGPPLGHVLGWRIGPGSTAYPERG